MLRIICSNLLNIKNSSAFSIQRIKIKMRDVIIDTQQLNLAHNKFRDIVSGFVEIQQNIEEIETLAFTYDQPFLFLQRHIKLPMNQTDPSKKMQPEKQRISTLINGGTSELQNYSVMLKTIKYQIWLRFL